VSDHDAYPSAAAFDLINPGGEWLLLLLHGLGGDRQQALGLVEGFRDSRFAILAPDLRAHGDTTVIGEPEAFTFDALVADIGALLERLGVAHKPTYVAGISMGAALALRLATSRRMGVRGAALIRPAFDDTPNPDNLAVLPVIADLLRSDDPASARDRLLASPEYRAIAAVTASGAKSAADQLDKPQARERAIRLSAVPKNVSWDDDDELRRLDIPTVVVGADRDVMHPLALAQRTAALIPSARLVEVVPRDIDPVAYDREIREAVQRHVTEVIG
jgi:pimeloyl-ACP methyl ester carboxylesterase